MIIHDVEQGTPEWFALRLGIPTVSNYHRIISPKKLQLSKQRDAYAAELVAEWRLGERLDDTDSAWMGRGRQMEDEARTWYEFDRDCDVRQVGFCTMDDGRTGGSPDGLLTDGIIEIKCRSAAEHQRIESQPEDCGATLTQVHGYLMITGAPWCDVVSYNPKLGAFVRRVERDEDYIGAVSAAVLQFCNELDAAKGQYIN